MKFRTKCSYVKKIITKNKLTVANLPFWKLKQNILYWKTKLTQKLEPNYIVIFLERSFFPITLIAYNVYFYVLYQIRKKRFAVYL